MGTFAQLNLVQGHFCQWAWAILFFGEQFFSHPNQRLWWSDGSLIWLSGTSWKILHLQRYAKMTFLMGISHCQFYRRIWLRTGTNCAFIFILLKDICLAPKFWAEDVVSEPPALWIALEWRTHSCATEAQEILEKVLQGWGTQPSLLRWHLASGRFRSRTGEDCCGVHYLLQSPNLPQKSRHSSKKGKDCHDHLRSRCRRLSSTADLPATGRGSGRGRGHSSGCAALHHVASQETPVVEWRAQHTEGKDIRCPEEVGPLDN